MTSVIFDDHRFCAGRELDVKRMPEPHTHSQIELNYLLAGHMTYLFNGRAARIEAGRLALFWGTIPHQVIDKAEHTTFVCLYVPISIFLGIPLSERFRGMILQGALIEADRILETDLSVFSRWREELLRADDRIERIVRDELSARIRRIDLDGWSDVSASGASPAARGTRGSARRLDQVERMTRFISDHAGTALTISRIAEEVELHPNYAMTLFRDTLGMTISQYLIRQRLQSAQALLLGTDGDITSIAFESGFGSVSRFYDAFGSKFGMTPREYRLRFRNAAADRAPTRVVATEITDKA
jgi:AraC-like DNA-binding protein